MLATLWCRRQNTGMETFTDYLTIANVIYVALSVISLVIIFLLHVKSEGRTSPIAAGTFVIFGPVLGVVITSWHALREIGLRASFDRISEVLTNGPDLKELSVRVISMGLAVAAVAAIGAAIVNRNEWFNHLRRVK